MEPKAFNQKHLDLIINQMNLSDVFIELKVQEVLTPF